MITFEIVGFSAPQTLHNALQCSQAAPCVSNARLETKIKGFENSSPKVQVVYNVLLGDGGFCLNRTRMTTWPGGVHQLPPNGQILSLPTDVSICRGPTGNRIRLQVIVVPQTGNNRNAQCLTRTIMFTGQARALAQATQAPEGLTPVPVSLSTKTSGPDLVALLLKERLSSSVYPAHIRYSIASHWNVAFEDEEGKATSTVERTASSANAQVELAAALKLRRTTGRDPGNTVIITATIYDQEGNFIKRRHAQLALDG